MTHPGLVSSLLLLLPLTAPAADPAAYYGGDNTDPLGRYYAPAPARQLPGPAPAAPPPAGFDTRCAGALDRAACLANLAHRGSAAALLDDSRQLLAPASPLDAGKLGSFEGTAARRPLGTAGAVTAGTLGATLGAGASAASLAEEMNKPAGQRDAANLIESGGGLAGTLLPGAGAASSIGADAVRAQRAPPGSLSRLEYQGRAAAQGFGALAGGAWCSPGGPGTAAECAEGGATAAAYLYDAASAGTDRFVEWRDQQLMREAEERQAVRSREHLARQRAERAAAARQASCQASREQAQQALAAIQGTGWRQTLASAGDRAATGEAWRTLESLENMNQWALNQACQPGATGPTANPYDAEFRQHYLQLNSRLPPNYRQPLP